MANGHGGARKGAGQKARPSRQEEQNSQFDVRASNALPELFDTLYAIATGYKVAVFEKPRKEHAEEMKTISGETVWVYYVPPDKDATKYLVDRAAGKAATKNPEKADTELTLQVFMPGPEEET